MEYYLQKYNLTYHDQFYTDNRVKTAFKNFIRHVLDRTNSINGLKYKDDPAIMMWELANEPRCFGSNYQASPKCTPATITKWADEISTFIKSVDKNHLVAIGDEGFFNRPGNPKNFPAPSNSVSLGGSACNAYDGSQGIDFEANLRLPNIDVGTFHMYPDWWGYPNAEFGRQYIADHAAVMRKVKKPVIVEEFGTPNSTERLIVHPQWNKEILKNKLAASLYWMLAADTYGSRYPDYDHYTIYADDPNITTLVINHAHAMDALNF